MSDLPAGTPLEAPDGDCHADVCDGAGNAVLVADPSDVPADDGNPCTLEGCVGGAVDIVPAEGAPCSNGGVICHAGACVACLTDADCSAGKCAENECISCSDGAKNGVETGLDCGGLDCLPCPDGSGCALPQDCLSDVCTSGICENPSCGDSVKNGLESDLDCGGPLCLPCPQGSICALPHDCQSGVCASGICQAPTCADAVKNGLESDLDCGGPLCLPCPQGSICALPHDCQSGVCASAVCQEPTCSDGVQNGAELAADCGNECPPCGDGSPCLGTSDCESGYCAAGACATPRSCLGGGPGAGNDCGLSGTDPCCASIEVPGGTFNRNNDPAYPATVSSFSMDRFEVDVGRFRAFVDAGGGTQASAPAAGSGSYPGVPGSGWQAAYSALLPSTTPALRTALTNSNATGCNPIFATYTSSAGPSERKPVSCVSWPVAYAFCIWDGGRLPTEAQWLYAAAGGDQQRAHPWGNLPIACVNALIDDPWCNADYASLNCQADGDLGDCTPLDVTEVGRHPLGAGRWGHADLFGNVTEWMRDGAFPAFPTVPCVDCVEVAGAPTMFLGMPAYQRVTRGESFYAHMHWPQPDLTLLTDRAATWEHALGGWNSSGLRCVR